MTLSGNDTYNGLTTINSGDILKAGSTSAFSVNSSVSDGGTLDLGGFSNSIGALSGNGAVIDNGAPATLTVTGGGFFTGNIQDGSGTVALTVAGATQTLTLSGNDTYSGLTTINSGDTLKAGSTTALTGATSVTDNGTLDLNGFSNSIGALNGSGAVIDSGAAATLTVTGGGSFSGNISGANTALTVAGATQTLTLSGNDTYSGPTTINGGDTLKAGSTTALTGATSVTDNGTLDLNGNNLTIGALNGSGAIIDSGAAATLTVTGGGSFSGNITGANTALTVGGTTQTLTLSGDNTYGGLTTINSGDTLKAGSTTAFSSNSSVNVNGTLDLAGFNEIISGLTGSGIVTNSSATAATFTFGNNNAATSFGGTVTSMTATTGTLNATKIGSGDMVFSGAQAFQQATGTITVSGGDLQVNTQTLTSSLKVSIGTGATFTSVGTLILTPNENVVPGYTAVSGAGTLRLGNASSSAASPDINLTPDNYGYPITLASTVDVGTGTRYLNGVGNTNDFYTYGGDLVIGGALTGSANIVLTGLPNTGVNAGEPAAGSYQMTYVLAGNNNGFTGAVTISQGCLVLNNANALTAANNVTLNPTAGTIAGLFLYGSSVTIGNLTGTGAGTMYVRNGESTSGNVAGGGVGVLANATLTVNETGATSFNGVLSDGPNDTGTGNTALSYYKLLLAKTGAGTLTLTAANSYTGATTISAGTLSISSDANLGTSPSSATPGQLVLSGGTLETTASFALNSNRGINLGTANGAIDVTGADTLSYGGIMAGTGALIKTDTGMLTLSGPNTYIGSTTVSGGVLSISADTNLGTAPASATPGQLVLNGGTLQATASFALNSNRGGTLGAWPAPST